MFIFKYIFYWLLPILPHVTKIMFWLVVFFYFVSMLWIQQSNYMIVISTVWTRAVPVTKQAGADPGFEIRGGANGKFQEKQGGVKFKYDYINIYI